jgi:hypothetical protein
MYELDEVVVHPASPKVFVSDEKFAYLGRNYRLKYLKKVGKLWVCLFKGIGSILCSQK